MAQTILNDKASEALHHLNADITAALRYVNGDSIPREHAERWADDLKIIREGRVNYRGRGGKKDTTNAGTVD